MKVKYLSMNYGIVSNDCYTGTCKHYHILESKSITLEYMIWWITEKIIESKEYNSFTFSYFNIKIGNKILLHF